MIEPEVHKKTKPYPGLRPFLSEEADLFFGREEQVDALLDRLQNSRFVAVIGPSGCGKSSLVKAGLIPALKTGLLVSRGPRWRIVEMRPGNQPFVNLTRSVLKAFPDYLPEDLVNAELKRSPNAFTEVVKSQTLRPKENVLLIVDQFEELFRFRQNNNIDEVTAFIKLLISSVRQEEGPIHVVITMRSDYLGECSLFYGLPEILNDNQFLTPRLTREQSRKAIVGPSLVCEGEVKPVLVNTLLNDLGVDHDQLPLLQHVLMRMWDVANPSDDIAAKKEATERPANVPLTLEHYNAVGKLSQALSNHANQVYDQRLNSEQRRITEIMFKRLTERNAEQKDVRRPTTVQEIADVAEAPLDAVIAVADKFRSHGNNFLMPDAGTKLTANSYLDITHESLMRLWDKLKAWIDQENRYGRWYQRLAERSIEDKQLIQGLLLAELVYLRDKYKANLTWAKRYHSKELKPEEHEALYNENLNFLKRSEAENKAVIEAEKTKIKEEARRQKEEELRLQKVKEDAAREFQEALQLQSVKLKAKMEKEEALRLQKVQIEAQREREEALRLQEIRFQAQREKEDELRLQKIRFEEKAKGRRRLLRLFGAALLLAFGLSGYTFYAKEDALRSKQRAIEGQQKANSLSVALKQSYETIQKQKIWSDTLKDRAERLAESNKAQAEKMGDAFKKADFALKERDKFKAQWELRNAFDFVKSQLFFNSKYIKNTDKDTIAQAVFASFFKERNKNQNQREEFIKKYVDISLLNNLNRATIAREEFIYDPVGGLRMVKPFGEQNFFKNKSIEKILSGIFEQKIFPSQEIDPLLYQNSSDDQPYLLSTNNHSGFALINSNQIVTGGIAGNSLGLTNVLWPKPVYSNGVLNDSLSRQLNSLLFKNFGSNKSNALFLKTNGEVILLTDDSLVVEQHGKETKLRGALQGSRNPGFAGFSANGKYIVTVNDSTLLLWDIIDMANGKRILPDILGTHYSHNKTIKALFFSPDGRTLAVSFSNKQFEVWDLENKKLSSEFGSNLYGGVAGFSTDGNFFIVQYNDRYVDIYDTTGKRTGSFSLFASTRNRSLDAKPATQIAISPDRKSLLVNYGQFLVSFTTADRNEVVNANGTTKPLENADTLYTFGEEILDARYLSPSTVISLTESGKLYKWEINRKYSSLPSALDNVKQFTDSTYEEKDKADPLAFAKLLAHSNSDQLRNAGNYYFEDELSNGLSEKAKQLFLVLQNRDTGFLKQIDSAKIDALERYAVNRRVRDSSESVRAIQNLQESVRQKEAQLALASSDIAIKKSVASDYWELSWRALFVEQYDSAIYYANRCATLDSQKDGVNTNLALAYLLKGDFVNAEAIYKKYNGKTYSDGMGRKFTDAFQGDFDVLIKVGIISKAKPDIYNKMEEIKTKILGIK